MRGAFFLLLFFFFGSSPMYSQGLKKISGLTFVAPPDEFKNNPMLPIKKVNAKWIALVPFGFARKGSNEIRFNLEFQWWGEKKEGIVKCIKSAHKNGLKVMLKPQIYIPGSWIGQLDFESEEEWLVWEKSYLEYINFYLDIAIEHNVEMFCIGTELKIAIQKRQAFWTQLIEDSKCKYAGMMTYSGNWDAYDKVPFWEQLDYIGLSAYFPLSEEKTPTKAELLKKWKAKSKELEKFSSKYNMPILFTEYGYLSIDGCAGKAWELEKRIDKTPINELAQANAYDALLETFYLTDFWAGGFLWKWFPNMEGHEGYPEKDYTPQGKLSEKVIKNWFSK